MRQRSATRPAPPVAKSPKTPLAARATPRWLRLALVLLAGLYLATQFSREAGDSDLWWHLAVGKYIWQNHRLPVPDPFSYTTNLGSPVYNGELTTRHFNLTHEWGMELIYYLIQWSFGFPGLILFRSLLLIAFCAVTGWLAGWRSASFHRGLAAALLTLALTPLFANDRAYLASFLLITITVAIFEARRGLWFLPPIFLLWANCHGGFVMGWAIAGVYSAEALFFRLQGKPLPDERKVWLVSGLAVAASLFNPNGIDVIQVMRHYRDSPMQIAILEWSYPAWWPPDNYNLLTVITALVLLWKHRQVRPRDWLLFLILGAASASAVRNTIFMAFIGPVLLASYLPKWKRPIPAALEYAAAALLLLGIAIGFARGTAFQLRTNNWRYPTAAADFLLAHHVTGPMFNPYEWGGYLMWRLWPQEKVFIDGRALNESVYNDYIHLAYNADYKGGLTSDQLLQKYGIDVIVMSGLDIKGGIFYLAAALSDPSRHDWKLVYQDDTAVIYMRHPPPEVTPLPSLDALKSLEAQCDHFVNHAMGNGCERALGNLFMAVGDNQRARKWLTTYLAVDPSDPEANRELNMLNAAGR
jgi:hypothetical protein